MNTETSKEYGFGSELDDLNEADWTPNTEANDTEPKPDLEQVRAIAEKEGFTSREPKPAAQKEPEAQVLIRGRESVINEFKDFGKTQQPKWPHAYVLERAMAALKKELEG